MTSINTHIIPNVTAVESVVAIGMVVVVATTCEFKGLGVLDNSNAFELKANSAI